MPKNNKTGRKKHASQSDKTPNCEQQDMNYATRIQLKEAFAKQKEDADTGTLTVSNVQDVILNCL